jgi:hypothetical protein
MSEEKFNKSVADLAPEKWKNLETRHGKILVNLSGSSLVSLEGCPRILRKGLSVSFNYLMTLVGAPKQINGDFDIRDNPLESLIGCPEIINGDLNAVNLEILSLVGCPVIINGSFYLSGNYYLQSLNGCAKEVNGDFFANSCKLTSLVDGPSIVSGDYQVSNNKIETLDGIPTKIGADLILSFNRITTMDGINKLKEMDGTISVYDCPITSHILGVFFIKGCKGINTNSIGYFGKAVEIVNRHIEKGRVGLLPCQKELIEAGLADFAQI